VVDHSGEHGSTLTLCKCDISNAFDRVDHYALLSLLMDRKIQKYLGFNVMLLQLDGVMHFLSVLEYLLEFIRMLIFTIFILAVYMNVLILRSQSRLGSKLLQQFDCMAYCCLNYPCRQYSGEQFCTYIRMYVQSSICPCVCVCV